MNKCIYCKQETKNPKFCNRSCAAKHNNTVAPKRKVKRKCILCDDPVKSYRHNRCSKHWDEYVTGKLKFKTRTLRYYHTKNSVNGKHLSWLNAHIRGFARSWNKDLTVKPCANCGYTLHVELCHIKALSEFNPDSTLGEINSPENIIQLCRNCHWEFDNIPEHRTSILEKHHDLGALIST